MSVIATAVRHLMAAGVTGEALVEAIAEMEASQPRDAAADRRRERDRIYQAEKRAAERNRQMSADSSDAGDDPLSLPPNENNSNPPTHTPEHKTRARKADKFPCPDWADPAVWRDLKANRKTKRLSNTPTAHRQFVNAVEAMADDHWPPGKLLEAIVAKGWGGAHDPREDRKPQNDRSNQRPQSSSLGDLSRQVIATLEGG